MIILDYTSEFKGTSHAGREGEIHMDWLPFSAYAFHFSSTHDYIGRGRYSRT